MIHVDLRIADRKKVSGGFFSGTTQRVLGTKKVPDTFFLWVLPA
jgi:hypothetical protein